jgi:hypothetical protein
LGEKLYGAGRLAYRKEIAEVHSLVIEIRFELSKQPNPQLKRQLGEIILQLAAKERSLNTQSGDWSRHPQSKRKRGRVAEDLTLYDGSERTSFPSDEAEAARGDRDKDHSNS